MQSSTGRHLGRFFPKQFFPYKCSDPSKPGRTSSPLFMTRTHPLDQGPNLPEDSGNVRGNHLCTPMSGVSQAYQQHRVGFSGSPWSWAMVTSVHSRLPLSLKEHLGPFPSIALRKQRGGQGTMSLRPPHNEAVGTESTSDFLQGLPELTAGVFWYILRGAFLPSVEPPGLPQCTPMSR